MLFKLACVIQNVLPKYFVGRGIYAGIVFTNLERKPHLWWSLGEFDIFTWVLLWVLYHNTQYYSKIQHAKDIANGFDFDF